MSAKAIEETTGQIDDPSISARFQKTAYSSSNKEFATTADKILGLLQDEPITVKLTKDVSMQFYPPSDEEYIDIISMQAEALNTARKASNLKTSATSEEIALDMMPETLDIVNDARRSLDAQNELLAKLSVDTSFTKEHFKRMPKKYKGKIITALTKDQEAQIKKIKNFREGQLGNRSVSDAQSMEPET